jgi:predicted RNA-binding Zn-ribbon protein involved in translation (DUF1610 family)
LRTLFGVVTIKPTIEDKMATQEDYEQAVESYTGWCFSCRGFTREMTEPDAEGYICPDCGEATVMGAENALLDGLIEFDEA